MPKIQMIWTLTVTDEFIESQDFNKLKNEVLSGSLQRELTDTRTGIKKAQIEIRHIRPNYMQLKTHPAKLADKHR